MKVLHFIIPTLLIFSLNSFSQNNTQTTPESPFEQFNFWIGDWEVYTNDELVGKNTIISLQNGHVLQENWISVKENFTGTSYSFYNPAIKKWQQIWIDKNGNNLLLKGNLENKKMVLYSDRDSYMGEPNSLHKITWTLLPSGDVSQIWESTVDDGKNWNVQFEGIYKRRAKPQ